MASNDRRQHRIDEMEVHELPSVYRYRVHFTATNTLSWVMLHHPAYTDTAYKMAQSRKSWWRLWAANRIDLYDRTELIPMGQAGHSLTPPQNR